MDSPRFPAGLANARLMAKGGLYRLLGLVGSLGELIGPVRRENGLCTLQPIKDLSQIETDCLRTQLPPKKFFLPPIDELLSFTGDGSFLSREQGETGRQVIFGLHPCDIHALALLDRVFLGEQEEPRYLARRQRTAIVGMDCWPDENCFCHSMKTDFVDRGFDLFLSDLGEDYFVRVGTSLGDEVVRAGGDLFRSVDRRAVDLYKERTSRRHSAFSHSLELIDLPQVLTLDYDSRVWDDLAEKCLGCGACTAVCPTCYCFDVFDQVNLDGRSGSRYRTWDSCLSADFGTNTGDAAGLAGRAFRFKKRYYHKQVAFVERYGLPACIGCGRCIAACPAEISVIDVLNSLSRQKALR